MGFKRGGSFKTAEIMVEEKYVSSMLEGLNIGGEYSPKMKIVGSDGTETKWFNLDVERVPVVIAWLRKHYGGV